MNLGSRLRRERERAGLTQAELGRALRISRGHVWKVEHDVEGPSPGLVERWARATGSAQADLVLEGPALFDLSFAADHAIRDPLTARRVLYRVPSSSRGQVAVWPNSGDAVLRLRVRGSALPVVLDLAGTKVPGAGTLGRPSVAPVRAAADLVTWLRAANEREAVEQVESRMARVSARGRITVGSLGRIFVASVAGIGDRASLRLQDIVEESPIGLFVPLPG
jgi:transcriptional regulator with XRE-family HTH domain